MWPRNLGLHSLTQQVLLTQTPGHLRTWVLMKQQRKHNLWKVCMKRHILRLLCYFIQSGPLDAFSLFSGGVTSWGWDETSVKKNALKVCEWTSEAAWTLPLPAPRGWQGGLHREVGTGGPPLGTGWLERRHNTDIWRSPDEPAGSAADEPCLLWARTHTSF